MEMQIPDFYTGAPIDPADLWFREEFIEDLWDELHSKHIIISAPRRTGKTSVLDFLAANPRNQFVPISVYVQDINHPADFILLLLDLFHERNPKLFRQLFEKGSKLIGSVLKQVDEVELAGFKIKLRESDPDWQDHWRNYGEEFFSEVRKGENKLLILMDEFPDMLLNMYKAHPELVLPFLEWFRGHRLKPHPKHDKVRWMICGSANLASTLDSLHCLDTINDLTDIPLPVLSSGQVIRFVSDMLSSREVKFEEEVPQKVVDELGRPVPVFLQMITQNLYRIWIKDNHTLNIADVEKAFADLVVSSGARDKLQHFYSRISRYYQPPKDIAAYTLLANLSLSSEGIERVVLEADFERILHEHGDNSGKYHRKQLFNQLLRDLENDFYVVEIRENTYDFASGLIKKWWRKYYA
jgi:uncharacterized protein